MCSLCRHCAASLSLLAASACLMAACAQSYSQISAILPSSSRLSSPRSNRGLPFQWPTAGCRPLQHFKCRCYTASSGRILQAIQRLPGCWTPRPGAAPHRSARQTAASHPPHQSAAAEPHACRPPGKNKTRTALADAQQDPAPAGHIRLDYLGTQHLHRVCRCSASRLVTGSAHLKETVLNNEWQNVRAS